MIAPHQAQAEPENNGARRARSWRRGFKYAALAGILVAAVVIPFLLFGDALDQLTYGLLGSEASRAAIATTGMLLLAADVLLPVPSSVVVTFLGGLLGSIEATIVGATGLSGGCVLGFLLGRRLGHDFAERQMGPEDFTYLSGLLDRYGAAMLAVSRPVPVLAEASVIAAGVAGMPAAKTLGLTTFANIGIAAVYASIGASAQSVSGLVAAFAASLAVPALALAAARVLRKRT